MLSPMNYQQLGGSDQGPCAHYREGFRFAVASRSEGRLRDLATDFSVEFQAWGKLLVNIS